MQLFSIKNLDPVDPFNLTGISGDSSSRIAKAINKDWDCSIFGAYAKGISIDSFRSETGRTL